MFFKPRSRPQSKSLLNVKRLFISATDINLQHTWKQTTYKVHPSNCVLPEPAVT